MVDGGGRVGGNEIKTIEGEQQWEWVSQTAHTPERESGEKHAIICHSPSEDQFTFWRSQSMRKKTKKLMVKIKNWDT